MGLVLEHSCINRSGESGALRFLDVGCGSGAIAIALLQEGKVEVKKSSDLSVVVGSLLVVTLSARQQIPKRRRVYLVMNCHYCSHCAALKVCPDGGGVTGERGWSFCSKVVVGGCKHRY